jgi:predicted N-acetyltransferase YhbS
MMQVRPFAEADQAAVVALLERSMGWDRRDDDRYAQFFAWKHLENSFGRSAAWVAVDGTKVVAFRTFMRWEFQRSGERVRAARAVDTATHPDYQGQGLFTRLTKIAVEDLRAEGVAFIFNTPNEKSRPGYLKMGWETVGRIPVHLHLRSPSSLVRLLKSRVRAEKWATEVPSGSAAGSALGDTSAVEALLANVSARDGLSTRRSAAFLSWRYGFQPLGYRVMLAGSSIVDGMAIFRLRRRGQCTEATICDYLIPGNDSSLKAQLARRLLGESGADYALSIGSRTWREPAAVPVPRLGPILTWRGLAETHREPLTNWRLALGDIELF